MTLIFGVPAVKRVTVDEWIAQWAMLAAHDPQRCMKMLFLLGFEGRPDRGLVAKYPSHSEGIFSHLLTWGDSDPRECVTVALLSSSVAALDALIASIGMPLDSLGASTALVAASVSDTGFVYKLATFDRTTPSSSSVINSDGMVILLRDDVSTELEDALRLDSIIPKAVPRIFLFISANDTSDAISVARRRCSIEAEERLRGRYIRNISQSNGRREFVEATSSLLQQINRLKRNKDALIQGVCVAALGVAAALIGLLAFNIGEAEKKSTKRGK